MNKKTAVYALLLGLLILQGCFGDFHCDARRRLMDSNIDTKINKLKDKIDLLEKDTIKSHTNTIRLAEAYNQLGLVYMDKQLWDSAIGAFQNCIKNGSDSANMHYSLGLAYANRGRAANNDSDFEKAEELYRRAIEMQNNLYDAKYALSILLFYHRNEKAEAITILENLTSENSKHYKSRFALAKFYYEMDKRERSLALYESLYDDVEKLPDSAISLEYRKFTKDNINIIMAELSRGKAE